MSEERDFDTTARDFVTVVNVDAPEPSSLYVLYPKIENPELRAFIKTGELIAAAAVGKGIELHLGSNVEGDEWLGFLPERVMSDLLVHGDHIARGVLKEARKQVNGSKLNRDREIILKKLSELMRSLGRPKSNTFELPPIPRRRIANSLRME